MRGTGVTLDRVRDGRMGGKKREGGREGGRGRAARTAFNKEEKWSRNSIQRRKRKKTKTSKTRQKKEKKKEKNLRPKSLQAMSDMSG